MCSTKEFLKKENKQKYFLTTIPKGLSVSIPTKDILIEFRELLSKFKGILVDEIVIGFSSTRSISH